VGWKHVTEMALMWNVLRGGSLYQENADRHRHLEVNKQTAVCPFYYAATVNNAGCISAFQRDAADGEDPDADAGRPAVDKTECGVHLNALPSMSRRGGNHCAGPLDGQRLPCAD
jgi:hypothetical protein